jgi:hypothetical protein
MIFTCGGNFLLKKKQNRSAVARELFQQAVTKDRTFADAYSGLATTYLLSSFAVMKIQPGCFGWRRKILILLWS